MRYIEAFIPSAGAATRLASDKAMEHYSLQQAHKMFLSAPKTLPLQVFRVHAPQWRVVMSIHPDHPWERRKLEHLYEGGDPDEAWRVFALHVQMLVYDL